MLDQHRRQMTRERERKIRLSKDVQTISKKLSQKRPQVAKSTSENTRKSRQREVDNLESTLLRAQFKVVDQDKAITTLQKKIDKEENAEQGMRDVAGVSGIVGAATVPSIKASIRWLRLHRFWMLDSPRSRRPPWQHWHWQSQVTRCDVSTMCSCRSLHRTQMRLGTCVTNSRLVASTSGWLTRKSGWGTRL